MHSKPAVINNAARELRVFISNRASRCDDCAEDLGWQALICLAGDRGALCLSCADLDHLVFLPRGDAALTRRRWPAWHVAPYVSIWAIESRRRPGRMGWWVVCGDLPTDYISAATIKHPREAMRAIAEVWLAQAKLMARGKSHADIRLGQQEDWASLAPLLETRASMLLQWANDESLWEDRDGRASVEERL